MPPTGPEEGTVRAALASRQERDGLFIMMLGATDTVELAGLAKRAGQLVKLLSLKLLKGGCAMNGNGDTKNDRRIDYPAQIEDEKWAAFDGTVRRAKRPSPPRELQSVTCLDDFKFLLMDRAYAICELGQWKTSHVCIRPERDGVSLLVLHIPDAI